VISKPDELFKSTASYYARYRPGYPAELFAFLRDWFVLDGSQRVLDLGCGTGQLAIPLSTMAAEVLAVDPEPEMLAEGAKLAAEQGARNIRWIRASSYDLAALDLGPGTLNLVTMGQSFHWMNRDQTLADLDPLVAPAGAIVLVGGGKPVVRPTWADAIDAAIERWLGPQRRAGSGTYQHPTERHPEILARSPFSHVERHLFGWRLERTLDELVGLQYSHSYAAPALLGDHKAAFDADLRHALAQVNPSGVFAEDVQAEVFIATHPSRR